MSIYRDGVHVSIECDSDGCISVYEGYGTSYEDAFREVLEDAKDSGWRARKKDGSWVHTCPTCNGRHIDVDWRGEL